MITNRRITVYHKEGLDVATHLENWTRYNYEAWLFGGKGAGINKGYDNANDVQVRIPYAKNEGLDIEKFKIGDIIVNADLDLDITMQQQLDNNYEFYNVTSINNNNFGNSPHIHLGGK